MDDRERFDSGMKVRRAVLGDAYVDKAISSKNAFSEPFLDLITRYAWGEIWSRPGLPRHTRSLITLAMMIALNRNEVRDLLRRPRGQHRLPHRPGSFRRDGCRPVA
jgi:4-carboxymuconolactone decarboxylase